MNMKSMVIGMATMFASSMKINNERKLEEIREEWRKSANYPRKKKKKVRKRLNLEYSIFSWDSFENIENMKF